MRSQWVPARGWAVVVLTMALAAVFGAVFGASTATAHTGLAGSSPADGATVDGPLAQVALTFTGTPTAVDDGIAVADAAGNEYRPVVVEQTDLVITATFTPPLPAGTYALAWRVRSDDTHFIEGTLTFAVAVAPASTTSTTLPPATPAPAPTTPADVEGDPAVAAAPTPTSSVVAAAPSPAPDVVDVASADTDPLDVIAPELGGESNGERLTQIGRLLFVPASIVAIGMLAFAAWSFAGRSTDLGLLITLARVLGAVIAVGAAFEVIGLLALFDDVSELLDVGSNSALVRLVAGGMIVFGLGRSTIGQRSTSRPASLSAAVVDDESQIDWTPRVQWRPTSADWPGLLGVAVVALSFAFDGHTVSEGPRVVHGLASVVHVVAAGVWAGGLVAFSIVLWRRHRAGTASEALTMVLRFSVVAMVALVMTALAGVAMALFIDNDVRGYLDTEWGRLLLVKLGAVGLAAAIGGYNHFVVLPALQASRHDPAVVARARRSITAEAALLVGAAIVTALLVAASTL